MPQRAVYRRIAADLQRRIGAGEWRPGEQLPSRADLAASYGIHEQSVRLAVTFLRRQGIIEGEQRRRLYVAYPPAVRTLVDADAPWPHGSETIEHGRVRADAELAGRLECVLGAPLNRETQECWDPGGRSAALITTWRRGRRRPHTSCVAELGAVLLREDQARALGLTVDTVAYRLVRTRLAASGVPLETADLILPMDRWLVRLKPAPASPSDPSRGAGNT
ncbi:GntR family transcriptional regulator [Streptomyces sp. NPDC051994]|uniref:GntR family transcriptional regulator n=1 Tax=unclassified Streptomyces TaxID=2593676 RepID=UPI003441E68A